MTQVDLNLLHALDVLLEEGSVTAAADRLNLLVPATSRTLARIRLALGDPILVRAGRGLVPTPRAQAIHGRVHELVEEAHALIEMSRGIDVAALDRTFTIRANDALISVTAARLIGEIQRDAPRVRLRFMAEGQEDLGPLRDGTIDLDLGVIHDLGPEVRTEDLYEEHLVGMVASGHPLASGRVTMRRLAMAEHVVVSRRGRERGALDAALEKDGLHRRIVAVVPTYTSAAHMVLNSELAGLFPSKYAAQVAAISSARAFEIPAVLPRLAIAQAWHMRNDADPGHRWLRCRLSQLATHA
jgi:DNA-binding transcriptional LysR family regulator